MIDETLGGMLGGLGLFFAGMWLLSTNLKAIATLRLRVLAASYIQNRFTAFVWGAIAGSVTQSVTSITFIAISMRQAGLISTGRAFSLSWVPI